MRTLTLLLVILVPFCAQSQGTYLEDIQSFQSNLNQEFKDPKKSPLEKDKLSTFTTLPFFPIDSKYRITASFKRTPDEKAFEMKTTTKRRPIYVKYGVASFALNGKDYELNIYRNLELSTQPAYKDYLFLPFMDQTNGIETYGGGRYVDLKVPQGDSLVIDFNKAYNPYCAYNHHFSCPLVPTENYINDMIAAGVMLVDDWQVMKLKDMGFAVRFPDSPTYLEDTTKSGLIAGIKQFRYLGDFPVDSNFVFQVVVKTYLESTCPQSSPQDYNDCFKDILAEKLQTTGGALMYLHHGSERGHDAFEFELLAQGKAFSRYKVVLTENHAYIVSALTMYEAMDNTYMNKFFDSFRVLE